MKKAIRYLGFSLFFIPVTWSVAQSHVTIFSNDGVNISYQVVLVKHCESVSVGWEPSRYFVDVFVWQYYVTVKNENDFDIIVYEFNINLPWSDGSSSCDFSETARSSGNVLLRSGSGYTLSATGYSNTAVPPRLGWKYGGYKRS